MGATLCCATADDYSFDHPSHPYPPLPYEQPTSVFGCCHAPCGQPLNHRHPQQMVNSIEVTDASLFENAGLHKGSQIQRKRPLSTMHIQEKVKKHPQNIVQFMVKAGNTNLSNSSIGFSQRDSSGFRGYREFDKKRILVQTSQVELTAYTYDTLDSTKVYCLAKYSTTSAIHYPPSHERKIIHSDFLEDANPSLIFTIESEQTISSIRNTLKIITPRKQNSKKIPNGHTMAREKMLKRIQQKDFSDCEIRHSSYLEIKINKENLLTDSHSSELSKNEQEGTSQNEKRVYTNVNLLSNIKGHGVQEISGRFNSDRDGESQGPQIDFPENLNSRELNGGEGNKNTQKYPFQFYPYEFQQLSSIDLNETSQIVKVLKETYSFYDYRSDSTIYIIYIITCDGSLSMYKLLYHEGNLMTTEDYTLQLIKKIEIDSYFKAIEIDDQHLLIASNLKITVLDSKTLMLIKEINLEQYSPYFNKVERILLPQIRWSQRDLNLSKSTLYALGTCQNTPGKPFKNCILKLDFSSSAKQIISDFKVLNTPNPSDRVSSLAFGPYDNGHIIIGFESGVLLFLDPQSFQKYAFSPLMMPGELGYQHGGVRFEALRSQIPIIDIEGLLQAREIWQFIYRCCIKGHLPGSMTIPLTFGLNDSSLGYKTVPTLLIYPYYLKFFNINHSISNNQNPSIFTEIYMFNHSKSFLTSPSHATPQQRRSQLSQHSQYLH